MLIIIHNKIYFSATVPNTALVAYPKGFNIIYFPDILVINVTKIPIKPTAIGIKKDLKLKAIINSIDINPNEDKAIYIHFFIPIRKTLSVFNLIIEIPVTVNV